MGIVIKQSLKNAITTYVGFAIGAINTMFLYTNFLSEAYYGLVMYLISTSNLFWPLISFGTQNTLIKFFSGYKTEEVQNRFLTLMLVLPLLVSLVLWGLGFIFYNDLLLYYDKSNPIVKDFIWVIFVLALSTAYFEIFYAWSKVKLKSVLGNAFKEIFARVCVAVLLVLLYYELITADQFILYLVLTYIAKTMFMSFYAFSLHRFSFSLKLPANYLSVLKYTSLILIAGSVATVLIDLDKTMIERYMSIENIAKYTLCTFIVAVIAVPARAMHQITYPLTAKLLNERNFDELDVLYKKSSFILFLISGFVFILIICNVNELFEIKWIPESYSLYFWVVLLIGFAKLYDSFLGINNSIIYNSDYYRLILGLGVGVAVLAFVLNTVFIPILGLDGAALATFGAVFIYNSVKIYVVWTKFSLHPFSTNSIKALTVILITSLLFYFWDFPFHPLVNILLKTLLISIVFYGVVFYSGLHKIFLERKGIL